jgi:hypothetical protein
MSLFGPIFIRTFLILIVLIVIKVKVLEGKCPSRDYSWCLQIDGFDNIILDGNRFANVKHSFRQISALFNATESKDFDQFMLINNQAVKQLDENTFSDFKFKNIVIKNCTKLERIDQEAFNGTKELVTKVYIDLISISDNNKEEFFEALNSLTNLQELGLFNHSIRTIPPLSFRQLFLTKLEIDGPLDNLNNNVFFKLDSLRILKLYDSIKYIHKHSFSFELATDKTLDIYFDIKFDLIESGTFAHIRRPITLNLFLNKLRSFDETIFEPLLISDTKHDLIFHGELKEMKNKCILFWLFRERENDFKGKFSFKNDPSVSQIHFNDCSYTNGQQEPSNHAPNIVSTESPINSFPYVSLINKNLIAIISSFYVMLFLFPN